MKYAGLIKNDVVDGEGYCVSYWAQGCTHRCPGCHNPETWSFTGGKETTLPDLTREILGAINANGINRNFSVLGGEPLAARNLENTNYIVTAVRQCYPNIKIYLWTGYLWEDLVNSQDNNLQDILRKIDVLIDGPYIEAKRNVALKMRGSENQRLINVKETLKNKKVVLFEN